MRACAILCAFGLSGILLQAQQPTPGTNSHIDDAAKFGNKKAPKREKAPTARTISGQVTDESGQALEGAMVTLTDKKTNERTSFFTKKDGRYRFEDLSFNQDYTVQARYKDFSSEARKLSQYDSTARPVRILEIDTSQKAAHGDAAENKKPQ